MTASSDILFRHWQPGDDDGVMRILGPMGWCTAERYAAKFDDAGLRPEDVLIAEREEHIVGHLMLPHRRLRFGETTLPFGGVGMVVVDPAARGAGIGAALLDRALRRHRAAGNALAGLFTMTTLTLAYEMYRRRGFAPVARRVQLHLPTTALAGAAGGLTARPAADSDRAAIGRLIADWAARHRLVSVEAANESLAGQRVIVRPDGALVGCLELAERPEGWVARRLVTTAHIAPAAALAAGLHGRAITRVAVVTSPGNAVHEALAPLADQIDEEPSRLMLACLDLTRIVAGLALEIGAGLRAAEAAPIDCTLMLAETGERLRLEWSGAFLTIDRAIEPSSPVVSLAREALLDGLAGRPPAAPEPWLAPLWQALFPARGVEMRMVDCW